MLYDSRVSTAAHVATCLNWLHENTDFDKIPEEHRRKVLEAIYEDVADRLLDTALDTCFPPEPKPPKAVRKPKAKRKPAAAVTGESSQQ